MDEALRPFFEEQIAFRLRDGTVVEGGVFIGETEFLPVEVLREDKSAFGAEYDSWYERWFTEQEDQRAEILQLHGNSKRYEDLRSAVEREQVVPFIGSGMSVPSGLPTWSNLLRKIGEYTSVRFEELGDLIAASLFEEAADLVALETNRNLLNERVEHELRMEGHGRTDGSVRLLPAIFPSLVITTNLDDVLEHCYGGCDLKFDEVLAGSEIARYRSMKSKNQRFLLKLHGDRRHAETRVLLSGEYDEAYATGSVVREELALLYRTNHVLFIGCSLGLDRTVRLISEIAETDESMPRHFALLRLPRSEGLRVEKEEFLSSRRIFPIWYDNAHDVAIGALLAGLMGLPVARAR